MKTETKNALILVVLSLFLGALGVDRFYKGSIEQDKGQIVLGVIKLLTLGGLGIWALIDFVIFLTAFISTL